MPPLPAGIPGPWKLVFQDDFEESTLDLTKWTPSWFGDGSVVLGPINKVYENGLYLPSQVKVSGGALHLTAIAQENTDSYGTFQYVSGVVTTLADKWPWTKPALFAYLYGYLEARIWLPGSTQIDNWPAFWTHGYSSDESAGEIDIMEGIGGRAVAHYNNAAGAFGPLEGNVGYLDGWHTYACDWEPDSVDFYYDGQRIGGYKSPDVGAPGIVAEPQYIVLNLAVSSKLCPPIVVPSVMKVDYVRVWQHE